MAQGSSFQDTLSSLARHNNPTLYSGPGVSEQEVTIAEYLRLITTIVNKPLIERKMVITKCLPLFLELIYDSRFAEREKFLYQLDTIDPNFGEHLSTLLVDLLRDMDANRQKKLASRVSESLKPFVDRE